MAGIDCKLQDGPICMAHCASCKHFDSLTYHCLYYQVVLQPVQELAAQIKKQQALEDQLQQLHELWEK